MKRSTDLIKLSTKTRSSSTTTTTHSSKENLNLNLTTTITPDPSDIIKTKIEKYHVSIAAATILPGRIRLQ
jgi:galactose-1-phosphate uridylyltransferase